MPTPVYDRGGVALYHGDCAQLLPALGQRADLVVTSPPYDDIRGFGGHEYRFERVAPAIADALAPGGVMAWHTNDMIQDGGYSGSSFDACLWFMRQGGLRLHDRVIFETNRLSGISHNRWINTWDFVFIFSKGRPRVFNPLMDKVNISAGGGGAHRFSSYGRDVDGEGISTDKLWVTRDFGKRTGIWYYGFNSISRAKDRLHPSPMPIALVEDLIKAYSDEGDLVVDPFSGGGTTAYAALTLARRAVGIEIHLPYIERAIAERFAHQPLFAEAGRE